jgi:hypothetical protein
LDFPFNGGSEDSFDFDSLLPNFLHFLSKIFRFWMTSEPWLFFRSCDAKMGETSVSSPTSEDLEGPGRQSIVSGSEVAGISNGSFPGSFEDSPLLFGPAVPVCSKFTLPLLSTEISSATRLSSDCSAQ